MKLCIVLLCFYFVTISTFEISSSVGRIAMIDLPNAEFYKDANVNVIKRDMVNGRTYFGTNRAIFRSKSSDPTDVQTPAEFETESLTHIILVDELLDMNNSKVGDEMMDPTFAFVKDIILDESSGYGYFTFWVYVFRFSLTDLSSNFTAENIIDIRNEENFNGSSTFGEHITSIEYDKVLDVIYLITNYFPDGSTILQRPLYGPQDMTFHVHTDNNIFRLSACDSTTYVRTYSYSSATDVWNSRSNTDLEENNYCYSTQINEEIRVLYVGCIGGYIRVYNLDLSFAFIVRQTRLPFDQTIVKDFALFSPSFANGELRLYGSVSTLSNDQDRLVELDPETLEITNIYSLGRIGMLFVDEEYDNIFSGWIELDVALSGVIRFDMRTERYTSVQVSNESPFLPLSGYFEGSTFVSGFSTRSDLPESALIFPLPGASEPELLQFQIANCSGPTTCSNCYADSYCGLCESQPNFCLFESSCTIQSDCPDNWSNTEQCPEVIFAAPLSGSVFGSTDVIIDTTNELSSINTVSCEWGSGTITGSISGTSIICASPAGTGNQLLSVLVRDDNCPAEDFSIISNITYSYYDCSSATDCDSCSDVGPECGWCYSERTCTRIEECPNSPDNWDATLSCPRQMRPSSFYVDSNSNVVIETRFVVDIPGVNYRCSFTGGASTETKFDATVSPSRNSVGSIIPFLFDVSCSHPEETFALVSVSVEVEDDSNTWGPYTLDTTDVILYDTCSSLTGCGDCLNIDTCGFSSGNCIAEDPQVSHMCTQFIDSINPPNAILNSTNSVEVTLVGFSGDLSDLQCNWDLNFVSAVTPVSANTVRCDIPLNIRKIFQLRITDASNIFLTGPVDFEVHVCEDHKTCDSCTSYEGCDFCGSFLSNSCQNNGSCISIPTEAPNCPKINSIDDASDHYLGGSSLLLEISVPINFPENANCYFQNIESGAVVTSRGILGRINSTSPPHTLSCDVPAVPFASEDAYRIGIGIGTRLITSTFPFRYYDCNFFESCSTCSDSVLSLGFSKCNWCGGFCDSCEAEFTECPVILNYTYANQYIDIIAENVEDIPLLCEFFNPLTNTTFSTATVKTDTSLRCSIPTNLPGSTAGIQYDVYIRTEFGHSYFDSQITHTNILCPSLDECSGTCFAGNSECSWCLSTDSCIRKSDCLDQQYIEDSCPLLERISPQYSGLSISSEPFNVTLTVSSSLDLTNTPGPIRCKSNREATTSAAWPISPTTIICEIRSSLFQQTADISLFHRDTRLTSTIRFIFTECSSNSICDGGAFQCNRIGDNICGWCVSPEGLCTFEEECSEHNWVSNYSCPTVTLASIDTLPEDGSVVQIKGTNFFEHPYMLLEMGGLITHNSIQYVDNSTLEAYFQQTDLELGSLSFRVYFGESVSAIPQEQPSISVEQSDNSIVPIIVVGIIIILLIIIAIILLKIFVFKPSEDPFAGLDVTPEKPDFSELLFPPESRRLNFSCPKDEFADFEEALFSDDKILFSAFVQVIGSDDADKASTALIYMAEEQGVTLEFMLHVINEEIEITEQAATIFRGNSLASKMFKTYSRLVGLDYVFDTLAKAILELQALDVKKEGKATDEEGIELDMIDFDLEVDENKILDGAVETNTIYLKLVCEKIFQAIMSSKRNIPPTFLKIFHEINTGITEKFGAEGDTLYHAIGGLFFLRFLIPSIFAPKAYGITDDVPAPVTQRKLILITKVLQSIANLSLPGKKEPFMESMTEFIQNKIPKIKSFYDEIMIPPSSLEMEQQEIPKSSKLNAEAQLWNIFKHKSERIKTTLENEGHSSDIVDELMESYARYAERKKR